MLNQFLVLGQIPGTQHQLTTHELAFIVLLTLEVYLVRKNRSLFYNPGKQLRFKRYNRFAVQLQLFK